MTMAEINVLKLTKNEASLMPETVAVDGVNNVAEIKLDGAGERFLIVIENAGAALKTATIKGGNSVFGGADNVISVEANKTVVLCIEDGNYKDTKTGKLTILGEDNNIKVAAILLA